MVALVKSMDADHPAKPVLVLSNRPDAGGLEKAAALGVKTAVVDHEQFETREEFEAAMMVHLEAADVDLLCYAGFMRIVTPSFAATWAGRALNIHPALLPKFKGLNTHARAIEAGDIEHGCSVHEVTEILDGGPVLGQARLEIEPGETPEELAARVIKLERELYPTVLRRFAANDRTPVNMV